MELKYRLLLVLAVVIIGFGGFYFDYKWTKADADKLNACVEYSFWKKGYRVVPCDEE